MTKDLLVVSVKLRAREIRNYVWQSGRLVIGDEYPDRPFRIKSPVSEVVALFDRASRLRIVHRAAIECDIGIFPIDDDGLYENELN